MEHDDYYCTRLFGRNLYSDLMRLCLCKTAFSGQKLIWALCVGSMLLPAMVTLIPLYIGWTRGLGIHDSYLPLILPYFCGGGAF